jgi:hypothetical protein
MALEIINGAGIQIPTPVKNTGLKGSELCGDPFKHSCLKKHSITE